MTDELKTADEIVRALRDYASDCDDDEACCQCTFAWVCDKFGNNAPKIIADLIDSLTAQLTESQHREKAAVCKEQTINHGMSETGEYDIECNLICPSCGAVVGDAEWQELNGLYCGQCGQRIEIGPQEAEKGEDNA